MIEFLGRGGFGEVWKCEAPGGLFKAMKFVLGTSGGVTDPAHAQQELGALQRIKTIRHPFLISLDRVELVGEDLLIVMELADQSLQDVFEARRREELPGIPREQLLGYLAEAAEALDVMNLRHGLLHLDVKPGNLFLVADHIKVADFGLVNPVSGAPSDDSSAGGAGFTPLYCSPERFLGALSPFSDQYSLAVVYQHLLTGIPTFTGSNARQLALQHVSHDPDLSHLPEVDRPVLARALSKKPEERFPSCLEFVHGLMLAGASLPPSTTTTKSSQPRTSRVIRLSLGQSHGLKTPMEALERAPEPAPPPRTESVLPPQRSTHVPASRSQSGATFAALPGFKFLTSLGNSPFGEMWKVQAPDGLLRLLQFLPELPGVDPAAELMGIKRLTTLAQTSLPPVEILELDGHRYACLLDLFEQTLQDRARICQAQNLPGIPRAELLDYFWSAAEALDYLHEQEGLHHLALTPRTLVLAEDQLKVLDAGLAELFGLAAGSRIPPALARYAAPELLEGQASPACDQFSLALIFCEMLTGLHPYRGQPLHRLARGRERPKPSLELLTGADRHVILRALSQDPAGRYPNCAALLRALESGEAETIAEKHKATSVHSPSQAPTPSWTEDTAGSLHRLHRLLASLDTGGKLITERSGAQANVRAGLEHRCGARAYGPTTKIKLDGFQQQWNAARVHHEPCYVVYRITMAQSFWKRCLGQDQPGLEVSFHFAQPQSLAAQLTQVTINIRPIGCDAAEGARLLKDAGPFVLDSARSYLQATPERRGQERLKFTETMQIQPLFPGREPGSAIGCRGKDISVRGIGLVASGEPPSPQILVHIPDQQCAEPITMAAEILRVHCRADGLFEIGARFAFGGFGRNAPLDGRAAVEHTW